MISWPVLVRRLWRYGAAKGDLFPLGTDGFEVELPVGTDGTVLTADSTADGGMVWGAGGGSSADDIVIDDADFSIVVDEATGTVVVAG